MNIGIFEDMNDDENPVILSAELLDFIKLQTLRHFLSWKTKLYYIHLIVEYNSF